MGKRLCSLARYDYVLFSLKHYLIGLLKHMRLSARVRDFPAFSADFKMLSIIGGQVKSIDMRKKSCLYVGLRKFKDTVRNRSL